MATVTALLLTSAGPANAAPKPITFVSHRLHTETLDLGTPGPSMGDISVMTGEILSPNESALQNSPNWAAQGANSRPPNLFRHQN